jgi:hypothetical protein
MKTPNGLGLTSVQPASDAGGHAGSRWPECDCCSPLSTDDRQSPDAHTSGPTKVYALTPLTPPARPGQTDHGTADGRSDHYTWLLPFGQIRLVLVKAFFRQGEDHLRLRLPSVWVRSEGGEKQDQAAVFVENT